VSHWYGFTSNV